MSKLLQFQDQALKSILKGLSTLAKAVKITLGPKGRNVVINKGFGAPISTKDGVTVAKEISLKDKFENTAAQLVKEVASKTADQAGDGTTTAIVLAEAIFVEGLRNVAAGVNPMALRRSLDKAAACVIDALDQQASPIKGHKEIEQIATISANNDAEIGKFIADAMDKVGADGIITAQEGKNIETTLDVVKGMQFDKGYLSPYFVTNAQNMSCNFDNALVLITDRKLSAAQDLVPMLEKVMERGQRPLLIIAEDVDSEALATLVVNKVRAGLPVCCVKAPGFGDRRSEMLQDIATVTGATVVSEQVGLDLATVGLEVLGQAKTVTITKDNTTIVDGKGAASAVEARATQVRTALDKTTSDYEREKLQERLAKLVGGVAVIHVGAATETEMKEKKFRVEDALCATRAAVADGVVCGGGVALLRAAKALENFKCTAEEDAVAVSILKTACFAPATAIIANCGKNGALYAAQIYEKSGNWGYNGATDTFGDLIAEGVLDPVLVTKTALLNANSIAGLLLTTDCVITDKPVKASAASAGGMPDMGGMGGMM